MKAHLFWLPLIGALLAFKMIPSIRYEDAGFSATLARGNDIFAEQIQETEDVMDFSLDANPRYAKEFDDYERYKTVFDEMLMNLDTVQNLATIDTMYFALAKAAVDTTLLGNERNSNYRDKYLCKTIAENGLSVLITHDEMRAVTLNQEKLLLEGSILYVKQRFANFFLDRIGGRHSYAFYRERKMYMSYLDSLDINIACGTRWSRKYSDE